MKSVHRFGIHKAYNEINWSFKIDPLRIIKCIAKFIYIFLKHLCN